MGKSPYSPQSLFLRIDNRVNPRSPYSSPYDASGRADETRLTVAAARNIASEASRMALEETLPSPAMNELQELQSALEKLQEENLNLTKDLLDCQEEQAGPDDYWGEDPKYLVDDWRYEVATDNTRLGYWGWVEAQKECHGTD